MRWKYKCKKRERERLWVGERDIEGKNKEKQSREKNKSIDIKPNYMDQKLGYTANNYSAYTYTHIHTILCSFKCLLSVLDSHKSSSFLLFRTKTNQSHTELGQMLQCKYHSSSGSVSFHGYKLLSWQQTTDGKSKKRREERKEDRKIKNTLSGLNLDIFP